MAKTYETGAYMKIIDIHAHIYPDRIARSASSAVEKFYDLPVRYDGTVETLLETTKESGVDAFVVHSVATDPVQTRSINDFIARTVRAHPGKLTGFATLHPLDDRIESEVDRIIRMGLKGIKIHPDFQQFNIDSEEAFRIYEAIRGRLPVLIHTGDYRYEYSKPRRVAAVLDRFVDLQVICAHFGGWSEWGEAAEVLAGRDVYVDTSSSLYSMTGEQAIKLIDSFGADRVLFGSDYPMWDAAPDIAKLKNAGLKDDELEKIFHLNAERLLGL